MKLHMQTFADATRMSRAAALRIVSALRRKPDLLLCASAGGTPTRTYEQLAALRAQRPRLFSRMRVLQIDEWAGLEAHSPATCAVDLQSKLLAPLGISAKRFFGFRTAAPAPQRECRRVARWLQANGPIDICILGLGLNGHIAMNEPGPSLVPHIHFARLAPSSRQHSMLQGLSTKPSHGYTLGMADILNSREVLLLVSGPHKRMVMHRLMSPRVNPALPASFLWLHGNAHLLCDRDAAPT